MDETPMIQQYLQLRSEFMGYLYAMTRDAELAEEVYQNAAVVVIESAEQQEAIRNFRAWAKEVVRRQALHARQLGLMHPKRTEWVEWMLEPPKDLQELLAVLREDRDLD